MCWSRQFRIKYVDCTFPYTYTRMHHYLFTIGQLGRVGLNVQPSDNFNKGELYLGPRTPKSLNGAAKNYREHGENSPVDVD